MTDISKQTTRPSLYSPPLCQADYFTPSDVKLPKKYGCDSGSIPFGTRPSRPPPEIRKPFRIPESAAAELIERGEKKLGLLKRPLGRVEFDKMTDRADDLLLGLSD